MLNKIWFWLFVLGVVVSLGKSFDKSFIRKDTADSRTRTQIFSDSGRQITEASFESAKAAVELCLKMVGGFALFLGLMRIAQDAGLVQVFANAIKPLIRWLFPGIPDGHAAAGTILMNMATNILGVDNAATPIALKAMKEMQSLNPVKDTATNEMAMFLAINTGSICLVPTGILVLRAAAKSTNPSAPILFMLVATSITTIVAVMMSKWLAPKYPVEPPKSLSGEVQS